MIADQECSFCYGIGRLHSAGRNGDPLDPGVECPKCGGSGVIEVDLEEFADDEDETP